MLGSPSFVLHEVIVGSAASTAAALHSLSEEDLTTALPELSLIAGALQEAASTPFSDHGGPVEMRRKLELLFTQPIEPEVWSRVRASALKKNVERFREVPFTLHTPFPNEDMYEETLPYLVALKSYVSAQDKDGMTLLERKLAKVTAVSQKIERDMTESFGKNREEWPKNLRNAIQELYNIGNNIVTKMGIAIDSFTAALKEM